MTVRIHGKMAHLIHQDKLLNMKKTILLLAIFHSIIVVSKAQATKGFGFSFFANGIDSVKVDSVYINTPAAKAGFKRNDFIVSFNGEKLPGKTLQQVADIFKNSDVGNFVIKRNEVEKNITATKAFTYTYDRKCLSGDCVNGFGKGQFFFKNNFIFEGNFTNGVLNGESKVYRPNGALYYIGGFKDFKVHGQGKFVFQTKYKVVSTGEIKFGDPQITQEGTYDNDKLIEGSRYNKNGSLIEKGKYNADGDLISGIYVSRYRGENVYIECSDIITKKWSDGTSDKKLAGLVKIHLNTPDGKIISEGYYSSLDRLREGVFKEYDYTDDVKHAVNYRGGGVSAFNNDIYRISDGSKIATNVIYTKDVQEYFTYNIETGIFQFEGTKVDIGTIGDRWSLSQIKKQYDSKKEAAANYKDNSSSTYNSGSSSYSSSNNSGNTTYSQAEKDAIIAYNSKITQFERQLDKIYGYLKEIGTSYRPLKNIYLESEAKMLEENVGDFIYKHGQYLPDYILDDLKDIKATAQKVYYGRSIDSDYDDDDY